LRTRVCTHNFLLDKATLGLIFQANVRHLSGVRVVNMRGLTATHLQAEPSLSRPKSRARSAITNGSRLLDASIDGRSAPARRFRDLYFSFVAELGGEASLTEAERALCRQAAALTLRAEELQNAIVRGDAVEDEQAVRLANSAARALGQLRRRARPRPKGPTLLAEIAASLEAERA